MRLWVKVAVLAVWLPAALIAGPVIGLRDTDPGNIAGGLVTISSVFATAWLWSSISEQPSWKAPLAAAVLTTLPLILIVPAHISHAYRAAFTEPREVIAVETVCRKVKGVCTFHTAIATLDGERLPHTVARAGFEPGEVIVVRWDRNSWATPQLSDAEPDRPLVPLWAALPFLLLYAACTVYFARATRGRPKSPGPNLPG
ncbi:hypothetical protein [Nocardia sp. NPDC127526]|uniref:hypothetical protein n=1 Tax=Nocardia sp. NPDC127526 TaxID=3345393 RepID=UPI0036430C47